MLIYEVEYVCLISSPGGIGGTQGNLQQLAARGPGNNCLSGELVGV